MTIEVPENSLILLISGKICFAESFAEKFFRKEETFLLSSLSDPVFDKIRSRLELNRLTVVCLPPDASLTEQLLDISKSFYLRPVSLVFRFTGSCETSQSGMEALLNMYSGFKDTKRSLKKYGFRFFHVFNAEKEAWAVEGFRTLAVPVNKKGEHGPFDIIGDIHGCYQELALLLSKLGYAVNKTADHHYTVEHPLGRKVIFLGDLVDRGPEIPEVLRLVMDMTDSGVAFCILGNHDEKLFRKLKGRNVMVQHGLEQSMAQLQEEPDLFHQQVLSFLGRLTNHLVLDEGKLVVTHAAIREQMIGKVSDEIAEFCMYGDASDNRDQSSQDDFLRWAEDYHGQAFIVYGHSTISEPVRKGNTINIDTGCVIGGKLTAFRYPEMVTVSVKSVRQYAPSESPL